MKKFVKIMALTLCLVSSLVVGASAASFTATADALNEMGLFQGSGDGYDLDRAPTRAEAAVMLTRMLGQEEAALDGYADETISHPFEDTDPWMDPYIAYLYVNGYTAGYTDTTFAPTDGCTDQMYVTFLLRALGYFESQGDFTYDTAMDFGAEIGLVDAVNCYGTTFLRDNVVALTYTALTVQPKDGEETLYAVLKADGVISEDSTANDFMEGYSQLCDHLADMEDVTAMTATGKMDARVSWGDVDLIYTNAIFDMAMEAEAPADLTLTLRGDYTVEYALLLDMENVADTVNVYVQDGWVYTDKLDEKVKTADSAFAHMAITTLPVCLISDYDMDGDVYQVHMNQDFVNQLLVDMGQDSATVTEAYWYVATNDDGLDVTGLYMTLAVTQYDMDLTMTVHGELILDNLNETMTFDFPEDLDTYQEA